MRKIVINDCYGGFSLSEWAAETLGVDRWGVSRDDPFLVALLEKHGSKKVGGNAAILVIVEIPDDVDWIIEEYDGIEHVCEKHRKWYPRGHGGTYCEEVE